MADIQQRLNKISLPLLDDKVEIRGLLLTLVSEKWLILGVMLVTFLLGSFYAFTLIPQYQANVLLQVENKQTDAGIGLNLNSSALGSFAHQNANAAVQTTLMKSPFILKPVVESLGLDIQVMPHYFPLFGKRMAQKQKNLSKPFLGLFKYAWGGEHLDISRLSMSFAGEIKLIAGLNHTYEIYKDGKRILIAKVGELSKIKTPSFYFEIEVKNLIANVGTEFFISKLSTEDIANSIAKSLDINDLGQTYLQDKTGILQIDMRGSNPEYITNVLNAVAKIAIQKNGDRKSLEAAKTLQFLNEELPRVKQSMVDAEIALNKYNMKSGTIDLNVKSKMLLKQLADVQKEIEKVNISRIMLLQQFTPEHPYVISLKEKKLALQVELASLEKELQILPVSDQTAVGLMRDIKVRGQLYLMLLNKIQELQVVKAGTMSDIRVLNYASDPKPLPMGRFIILITSILFGFIASSLFIILRKSFYRCVEDPNWLEQHFGIPTFAIIPYSNLQKVNINDYKNHDKRESLKLLAHFQPRDLSIEALRSLRTSLQFALIGAKNNIISIMGVSPGIGKSFISANFAYILAESGRRVLLIDGDIRKGYLHDYFNLERVPGLTEIISGEMPLREAVQQTHLPNLNFIGSGKFPPNPSELLLSAQFKEILDALSLQYDLVIIDTAPVLAVTDGTIIGNHAGINFLVVANGMHQSEEIELTMKRLQTNHVTVQGSIFNNINASQQKLNKYNYHYEYSDNKN